MEGEPVWGNGCAVVGCRLAGYGVFVRCEDGVVRELCQTHNVAGKVNKYKK